MQVVLLVHNWHPNIPVLHSTHEFAWKTNPGRQVTQVVLPLQLEHPEGQTWQTPLPVVLSI